MENHDRKRTTKALRELFGQLGIQRVVFVDDVYTSSPSVEDVIGWCAIADTDALPGLTRWQIPFGAPQEIWTGILRKKWAEMEDDDRRAMAGAIGAIVASTDAGPEPAGDYAAATALADVLGGLAEFRPMSYTTWKANCRQLTAEAAQTTTLFLFDQDLSHDGGAPDEGTKLVQRTVGMCRPVLPICGLLTHRCTPMEELDKWALFAREANVPLSQFVLISKQRLSAEGLGFARMLKLAALNGMCAGLLAYLVNGPGGHQVVFQDAPRFAPAAREAITSARRGILSAWVILSRRYS